MRKGGGGFQSLHLVVFVQPAAPTPGVSHAPFSTFINQTSKMWSADQKKQKKQVFLFFSCSEPASLNDLCFEQRLKSALSSRFVELSRVKRSSLSTRQHIWSLCSGSALILTKKQKRSKINAFLPSKSFFRTGNRHSRSIAAASVSCK